MVYHLSSMYNMYNTQYSKQIKYSNRKAKNKEGCQKCIESSHTGGIHDSCKISKSSKNKIVYSCMYIYIYVYVCVCICLYMYITKFRLGIQERFPKRTQ